MNWQSKIWISRSPATLALSLVVHQSIWVVQSAADEMPERVVVIGDIHADLAAAHEAFELGGAIDDKANWIGGELVVVQLGDFIGRSYEDREVLDFILDIREKAARGGGTVHVLIGNHEIFGARIELRWVDDAAYAAFEGIPDLDLDNPRVTDLPENRRARAAALMPGGHYARQLAEFPVVLRLGDTIFVHGGVTPHWARFGVERINSEIRRWFAGESGQPSSAMGTDAGNFDDIVVMSRHFSRDVSEDDCAMLEESLAILEAQRMIVAHSVLDEISAHCNERVWAIDVGMSRYYGGTVQVLEIVDGETVSILSH
jgi:hypothetical protein